MFGFRIWDLGFGIWDLGFFLLLFLQQQTKKIVKVKVDVPILQFNGLTTKK